MIKPATRNVIIYSLILLAVLALAIAAGHYRGGQAEADTSGQLNISRPAFSEESGFYDKEFRLSIACDPACTVYYTTDGSDPADENGPSEKALTYDGPLTVDDATGHKNVYSARTDTSTGFYEDLITQYSDREIPGYAAPDYPVDKCTVIRAVAVSENGVMSEESRAAYFVGKSAADYDGCSIISLVTDPANLFDDQKGIYVTGNRFTNYLSHGGSKWYKWDANYYMDGPDSERDADMQLFDPDGKLVCEKTCAIRIQGNVSRAYNQKSFSVFLRDADGNPQKLGTDIFGTGYDPEELVLSTGGQNPTTKFNSYALSQVLGDRFVMKHYAPSVVFLDGEYWGFYWITERYDPDWFEYYFGMDRENIVAVKFDGVPDNVIRSSDPKTREQQSNLYLQTQQYVTSHDMSDPEAYREACRLLDMDNVIDYYAIEIYLSNYDWPRRNKEFWCSWEPADGPCADCRWRSLFFDLDLGMDTGFLFHANALQRAIGKDELLAALWENEDFREQLKNSMFFYADEYFDPEDMDALLDNYSKTMRVALEKSWRRFYRSDVKNMDDFEKSIETRKKFFRERRAIAEKWFDDAPAKGTVPARKEK